MYLGTLKAKGEGRLNRRRETGNEKEDALQPQLPIPEKVAIKIIDMSKVEDIEDIRREVTIMKAIHHQHVVNLFEVFDSAKKVRGAGSRRTPKMERTPPPPRQH